MNTLLTSLFLVFTYTFCFAGVPDNDDIGNAKLLENVSGYCSDEGYFNNTDATPSGIRMPSGWNTEGKDVWFKFTALRTDISISVTGGSLSGGANTLESPLVALYTLDNTTIGEVPTQISADHNLTTAYKGGLKIGQLYYIRVSAENNHTGTFKLCLNNYNPPVKAGQDCATASVLCNKETFTELNVSGAGTNNHEAAGSCLGVESNTTWYKWTAARSGTLTYTITPTSNTDDIDWALYDLGVNGDCDKILPGNLLRCAAGSGVTCFPRYYKTGLNMTSVDESEQAGCFGSQDGFVKYVDMVEGHVYALIVDNFSSNHNGFTIEFGGTGEFEGPQSKIIFTRNDPCTTDQSYTFRSDVKSYTALKWNFGEGADLANATLDGTYTVRYHTLGKKTVTLEASGTHGCTALDVKTFSVGLKPATPVISFNKKDFCLLETLILQVDPVTDAIYHWTGPDNFSSAQRVISIPLTNINQSGDYHIVIEQYDCTSDAGTITISVDALPKASFSADPVIPATYSRPLTLRFFNQSADAITYLWEFGDGKTSEETNPEHVYTELGNYTVKLTAYTKNGCQNSAVANNLIILDKSILLIPNSFSPNGDNINDEFRVNISNLRKFNISIFNRYGAKIFTSNTITNSWDGTFNGAAVPPGAYFYYINGLDVLNKEFKYSGSITLIR